MIGTKVERQGIIRAGAKMIAAVSEATRAEDLRRRAQGLRRGPLRDVRPGASSPTRASRCRSASIAVMGPQAAVNAVYFNKIQEVPGGPSATPTSQQAARRVPRTSTSTSSPASWWSTTSSPASGCAASCSSASRCIPRTLPSPRDDEEARRLPGLSPAACLCSPRPLLYTPSHGLRTPREPPRPPVLPPRLLREQGQALRPRVGRGRAASPWRWCGSWASWACWACSSPRSTAARAWTRSPSRWPSRRSPATTARSRSPWPRTTASAPATSACSATRRRSRSTCPSSPPASGSAPGA